MKPTLEHEPDIGKKTCVPRTGPSSGVQAVEPRGTADEFKKGTPTSKAGLIGKKQKIKRNKRSHNNFIMDNNGDRQET